jgi:beta-fructofuranosidase
MSEQPPPGSPGDSDPHALEEFLRSAAAQAVAMRPDSVAADPWRQAFHVQPPVGLLNDPNGLVQHQGIYHLCYQWHPFAPTHGLKFWAHLTSPDLVHWTERPPALVPSHPYDRNGCYSGSALVHAGAIRLLYTGNVFEGGQRRPHQNLATLHPDGRVTHYAGNPVVPPLPGFGGDVRDPKVWTRDGSHWMVLGAQAAGGLGCALLLGSSDLVDWRLVGPMAMARDESGGHMWECPDLLRLGDRDVLVVSPMSDLGAGHGAQRHLDRTTYSVGSLDLATGRFTGTGFRLVDTGPDFYAAQSFEDDDGRVIMLAWMGMPDHAGQPEIAVKHPTVTHGWVHCLTVPRELLLEGEDLLQRPVVELEALRGDPVRATDVRIERDTSVSVAGVSGPVLDLELVASCGPGGSLAIRLREGESGRPVRLILDPGAGTATLDRTLLGTGEGGRRTGSFRPGTSVEARILLDQSSIEVFVDGGRLAMSARIYPPHHDTAIAFDALGADVRLDVTCFPLASA